MGILNFIELAGIDIDMNDLGVRTKLGYLPRRSIIKSSTKGDERIALL